MVHPPSHQSMNWLASPGQHRSTVTCKDHRRALPDFTERSNVLQSRSPSIVSSLIVFIASH